MMQEGMAPNVSPLGVMWSLCIEEHFYIIWAIVFVLIPPSRFGFFTIIGIVISFVSKLVFNHFDFDHNEILTHLDLFCYGGLLAYIYFYKLLNKLKKTPSLQIKEQRIRVPNYQKAGLLAKSYISCRLILKTI
mgnify:CR=1 FL=1